MKIKRLFELIQILQRYIERIDRHSREFRSIKQC